MMKLGCMALSYKDQFTAGEIDMAGFIDKAYDLRLDGIDIHTRAFESEDPGLFAGYSHALSQARSGDFVSGCEQ